MTKVEPNKLTPNKQIPEDLLLHRAPMLLINEVVVATPDNAESSVLITPSSSFYQEGRGVPSWIGLEYMAQTIGLMAGAKALVTQEGPPLGYLLGTRKYQCNRRWFPLGTVLRITTTEELFDGTLGVYNCQLESTNSDLNIQASALLTVYKANSMDNVDL